MIVRLINLRAACQLLEIYFVAVFQQDGWYFMRRCFLRRKCTMPASGAGRMLFVQRVRRADSGLLR